MEPRNGHASNGEDNDGITIVTREMMHRIIVPLTVVHGHVQLLRRRILQGNDPDAETLLETLRSMEEATRALNTELRALNEVVIRNRRDGDETGRDDV